MTKSYMQVAVIGVLSNGEDGIDCVVPKICGTTKDFPALEDEMDKLVAHLNGVVRAYIAANPQLRVYEKPVGKSMKKSS